MANYHLNMSYGKVGKTIPHLNYITATEKYTGKEKEVTHEIHNMPSWVESPKEFWELADSSERVNGRTYREIRISLPEELTLEQNKELLNEFLKNFDNHYSSVVIHEKETNSFDSKHNNIHAHIMFSPREIDNIERSSKEQYFKRANSKHPERGGAKKSEEWNDVEKLVSLRKNWEELQNIHLEKNNVNTRVSCESLAKQRQIALENSDINKYEQLKRNPVAISSKILNKKNKNEQEMKEIESFLLNKKIKHIKDEIYLETLKESKELNNANFNKYDTKIESAEEKNTYNISVNIQREIEQNLINIKTMELLNIEDTACKTINQDYGKLMDEINVLASKNPVTTLALEKINSNFKLMEEMKNNIPLDTLDKEKERIRLELDNNINKLKADNEILNKNFNDICNKNSTNKEFIDKIDNYYNNLNSPLNTMLKSSLELNSINKKIEKIDKQIDNSYETTMNILSKKQYIPLVNEIENLKNKIAEAKALGNVDCLSEILVAKEEALKKLEATHLKDMDKFTRIKLSFEKNLNKRKDDLLLSKEVASINLNNSKSDLDINNIDIKNKTKEIQENKNIMSINSLKVQKLQLVKNNLNKNMENISSIAYLSLTKGKYGMLQKDFKNTIDKIEKIDIEIIKLSDNKLRNMFSINKLENEKGKLTQKATDLSNEFKNLKANIDDKDLFNEMLKVNDSLNTASNKINDEIKTLREKNNELYSINNEIYNFIKDNPVKYNNLNKFKNKSNNIFKSNSKTYKTGNWDIEVEKDNVINL